ncbi:MAG: hypothetical protein GY906_39550 [bacterium]|nr:hypothetical protein [bacterium]
MNQDTEHLKILAIFHYVVGAMAALFACIPSIHFFIGLAMATGTFEDTDPTARSIGAVLMVIAAIFILLGWAFSILLVVAGRALSKHRNRTFCLVMAGVSCIFVPFGTVLGVFTILVLMRPSVQELFAESTT